MNTAAETKRDAVKRKIDGLILNGESQFVLMNNNHKFEFKVISVCGDTYKVFGGFSSPLRVFDKHQGTEEIIKAFEMDLKEIDMAIESCVFIGPYHFSQ